MDVAFIGWHTAAKGLKVETLLEAPLMVAEPANHALARKRSIGFDELSEESVFRFERRLNPGFYDHCQAFFEEINFKPHTIPEPDDHHILLGLIAEAQGIGLISASLQNVKRQRVVFRPLKQDARKLASGIAMAYPQSNPSAVFARFLALARPASRSTMLRACRAM